MGLPPPMLDGLLPIVQGVVGVVGIGCRLSSGTCIVVAVVLARVSHIRCFRSRLGSDVKPFEFCSVSFEGGLERGEHAFVVVGVLAPCRCSSAEEGIGGGGGSPFCVETP